MKFVAKKRKKKNKIKWQIFLFIISFTVTYYYLDALNELDVNTKYVINAGLSDYKIPKINISKIRSLLYMGLNYNLDERKENIKVIEKVKNDSSPKIYIYNTHQSESYDYKMLNAYNISYTVETASLILKDYLGKYGIQSYVERESISSYLNLNNLSYKDSYKASRYYIEKRLKESASINYIIDIHRDSLKKDGTTVNINGKSFAKVLFVVGLDNPGYQSNLNFANKVNNHLDKSITKGIIKKGGRGVNGVYNQDLCKNALLIEIGGPDNNIEEVNNTIIVLAKALKESVE